MITIDSLTKKYARTTVVDDVSFVARSGRVTGFLGPNGAGKSTTMRMVVGLTKPTSGSSTVAGRPFAELPNPGREIGVMLDASAQHAGRTGREILTIVQQMLGLPGRRVDEMLDLVSLTPAEADRRVGNYSLGMRQRLGIATALIGNPGVLMLDEPANGLDPAGIRWMRDLLRDFADRGGTVLLSSHLLREVEVIADDIVMIGHGRVVCEGAKTDLVRSLGHRCPGRRRRRPAPGPPRGRHRHDGLRRGRRRHHRGAGPRRHVAFAAGIALTELRTAYGGLEDMFLELTADTQREVTHPRSSAEKGQRHDHHDPVHDVPPHPRAARRRPTIPLGRVVRVELRKMFDTRSGFWLMASLVIVGVLATVGTILFAPDDELTHNTFAAAIGFPMTIVLPIIAILAITGEWSQRTGLTTFTLVPNRRRVLLAKTISSVVVGIAAMLVALVVGRRRERRRHRHHRDRPRVGPLGRPVRHHRPRQPAVPADRHDAGHGPPELAGRAGHVLRADAGPPDALRDPGRQPAGLRRRPAPGSTPSSPGRSSSRDRRRVSSGPRSLPPPGSGWSCRPSSGCAPSSARR